MPQSLLFNAFVLICIFATAIIAIPAPIPLPKSSYIHPRCINPSLSLHFTLLTRTSPPTPRPIILHPSSCPLWSRLLQPRFDLCHHRFLCPTTTPTAPENLDHVHEHRCRRPVPYHSPRHWLSGGRWCLDPRRKCREWVGGVRIPGSEFRVCDRDPGLLERWEKHGGYGWLWRMGGGVG